MTSARRTRSNFALDRAVELAREHRKPLVVLEGLRTGYRWASDRLHQFVIDGMADNARAFAATPVTYLPFVERSAGAGKGLLKALSRRASAVVADDYPAFFLPRMLTAASTQIDARLEAVDANGIVPMRAASKCFLTASSFRAYLQTSFREHIQNRPAEPRFDDLPRFAGVSRDIAERWRFTPVAELESPARLLSSLPIDHGISKTAARGGGNAAARALQTFINDALPQYGDDRNQPSTRGTSRLSPYLHFGHIGAHDVFTAVMNAEKWTTRKLAAKGGGKREGWWNVSPNAEGFLDQLITWRELGFNMCAQRPNDFDRYASLPDWARATLDKHRRDARAYRYSKSEFENADTHDPVWNAAQRELTREGWMHNYLRMLWGKKILEWTASPEEALETMIEIMNRHALDGRDPNSYTGYFWTLGRYDRPWAPERPIFGSVRYMSSDSTVKKLRMKPYLEKYGPGLPL
ncbi:MAG: deoxyribodipyrimidine photolyase [Acidobacteria bacterium]|nr:MAG: deoxyribodipyrimidine photolyase [Acidobacteriota bacterium]